MTYWYAITHPAIDLTLAEGARGVGGQRTALVLLLQPRLHPPSLSASLCSRHRLPSPFPVIRHGEFFETGQIQPCMLRGIHH